LLNAHLCLTTISKLNSGSSFLTRMQKTLSKQKKVLHVLCCLNHRATAYIRSDRERENPIKSNEDSLLKELYRKINKVP